MSRFTLRLVQTIGLVLVFTGLVAAYFAPLEIYVLYLFSAGGSLAYDGFRVGTLWFAVLVVMNLGYYAVAAICLPAGIGHLKLRRWGYTLTRLFLWFWLGAGLWLAGNLLLLLPTALRLDLSPGALALRLTVSSAAAVAGLIGLPLLVLRFYHGEQVRQAFAQSDPHEYWTERTPFPVLALLLLDLALIAGLHVTVFCQCFFPFFGTLLSGRAAISWIALCILVLVILIYGTARLQRWAWWGSAAFFALLSLSTVITFTPYRFYDIIDKMGLPAYELDFLARMTLLHDFPLVFLLAAPLLAALGLVLASWRFLGSGSTTKNSRMAGSDRPLTP